VRVGWLFNLPYMEHAGTRRVSRADVRRALGMSNEADPHTVIP
jgi:hypothetical protein